MLKILEDLIRLQEIDDQLNEIQRKMGDLPEIVNGLNAEIALEETQIREYTEKSSENQTLIHQKNGHIVDYRAKLEKYQEQLYLVTTNREYDALTAEIDYAKNEINSSEEAILNSEALVEELEEKIKVSEANIGELKEKLEGAQKNLTEMVESTRKAKAELETRRDGTAGEIPRKYLSSYDRVRRARKGVAVVPMLREACSGCHNRIIPQKRVEIQKGSKIIFCDVCGRFIYFMQE